MSAQPPVMETPGDLNDTDRSILELLREGRETRGSMADQLERHENYVGERLKWMRVTGLLRYHHEETALYEITEKGREWINEVGE